MKRQKDHAHTVPDLHGKQNNCLVGKSKTKGEKLKKRKKKEKKWQRGFVVSQKKAGKVARLLNIISKVVYFYVRCCVRLPRTKKQNAFLRSNQKNEHQKSQLFKDDCVVKMRGRF